MRTEPNRRPPVDQPFLNAIGDDLDYLEDHGAPPVMWRAVRAVTSAMSDELRWWREIQDQEFRE